MNAFMLRKIRIMTCTAVEYIKGEGAFCPVCAFFSLGSHRLIVSTTEGDGLRYAACCNCRFTFKTVEKLVIRETPEPLVLPEKQPNIKGKRRKKS
jgi:formate dehydrogenase maturation protein FdhE